MKSAYCISAPCVDVESTTNGVGGFRHRCRDLSPNGRDCPRTGTVPLAVVGTDPSGVSPFGTRAFARSQAGTDSRVGTVPERQGLSPNGDCPIDGCWDRPLRGQSLRDESIRSSTASAPALSSGSFRFPHFGLWTQDGQPSRQGQPRSILAVSSTHPAQAAQPPTVVPTPPAWPAYTKMVGAPV